MVVNRPSSVAAPDIESDEIEIVESPPAYNDDVMDVINRLVELDIDADPREVLGEDLDSELAGSLRSALRRTDPRTKQFSQFGAAEVRRLFYEQETKVDSVIVDSIKC